LNDFVTSASFASRSALDSDTVFCEIYTPGYPPQKKGSFGFYVKDLRSLLNLSALATPTSSGGSVQESIATKQSTDETAASVLSEPPEAWADCETCGGEGAINRTIHVYENGCGFSHPDVEIIPCTDCMGTGGAIVDAASTYCDICGGDCSSANPPVFNCPLAKQESCPESAPRTETAVRDWRKSVFTYEHNDVAGHLYYFAPQVTAPGPFLEQRHVQAIVDIASDGTFAGVELIDNMPPLNSGAADTKSDGGVEGHAVNSCHIDHVVRHAHEHDQGRSALSSPPKYKAAGIKPGPSDQLTKTPSADHDDGNLRGLSAPNHQPHAVSQGWRDDRVAVARALYEVGRKAIEPTLGMRLCDFEQLEGRDLKLHLDYADAAIKTLRNPPLPAPPSPAKTGGVE